MSASSVVDDWRGPGGRREDDDDDIDARGGTTDETADTLSDDGAGADVDDDAADGRTTPSTASS